MKFDIKEVYMYLLGLGIVTGFFVILYVVFIRPIPSANEDFGMIVIGALVAKFGDVVSYFFGSSKGSADKTEILKQQDKPATDKAGN